MPTPELKNNAANHISAPLRQRVFRRIWISSLFSNLGQQVLAVAAAWTMLQITHAPDMVAMVQTASMLPVMLLAVAAGAIADMYDRRRVAIAALLLSFAGAVLLAVIAALGFVSPTAILLCCFIVGSGIALYSPAWQSSASEVVGPDAMPAAIALYSVSSNAARSIGPAIGGIVVASAGMVVAFTMNALLYLPILIALYMWKRKAEPPRLPPERLDRAMRAGLRYVRFSPPIRRAIVRTITLAIGTSAIYALTPVVARQTLAGGPGTYGLLLGAFGVGAVTFGFASARIRGAISFEWTIRICTLILGIAILAISVSPFVALTALAMLCAGGAWMVSISMLNVSVQLASPRWVSGRALAAFQAVTAGGLASGAWLWGHVAQDFGLSMAMQASAIAMVLGLVLGFFLPVPDETAIEAGPGPRSDPVVALELTGRSGPLVIEIEYEIAPENARKFYEAMRLVKRSRERNGAFDVSIARDIAIPSRWIERFHYPTWNDYLRARDRPTSEDRIVRDNALAFQINRTEPIVRRMLERPFGSVRWRDEAPDYGNQAPQITVS